MVAWARVQNAPRVKELLQQMSIQERQAYDLTDGTKTQAEIARIVGVTQPNISYYWKKWATLGLTSESPNYGGRQKQNFSLSDFGISKIGAKVEGEANETQQDQAEKS
jgi:predicted transcriptional regulator